MNLLDAAIPLLGIGAAGWYCLRGIQAMRRGRAASCCPPAGSASTTAQLAELRAELQRCQTTRPDSNGALTSHR